MKNLYTIIAVLSSGILFAQSPWTQEKGKFYTQLSFITISNYDEIFGDPDYQTDREITDNTLQLYGEYGISNKTTLIVNLPVKFVSTGDAVNGTAFISEQSKSAFGNVSVGLRHQFYNKEWIISGQLNVEAHTGTFEAASGVRTGQDAWTFTSTVNFGRGFDKFYIQAFTGVDLKTNNYSNNFKIGGEIGTKVHSKIWLAGFVDVISSFNDGDVNIPLRNAATALYVNNQEYGAFGLKVIGEFNRTFGGLLGFGGAFSGNNVAKQGALTIGLYKRF